MEMCFPRLKKKTKIKKMLMRTIEYRRLKHVSKTICLTEDSTSLHPSIFRFFSEDPLVSRLCRSVNTTRNALYAHTHSLKILSLYQDVKTQTTTEIRCTCSSTLGGGTREGNVPTLKNAVCVFFEVSIPAWVDDFASRFYSLRSLSRKRELRSIYLSNCKKWEMGSLF